MCSDLSSSTERQITIDKKVNANGQDRWVGTLPQEGDNPPGRCLILEHNGRYMGVALACPHAGAPLTYANLKEGALVCSLHGYSYELEGEDGIGFAVIRDGDNFYLGESEPLDETGEAKELKAEILALKMELEAQRSANQALQKQVITSMENMDSLFSEVELKKTEWKRKSDRLERLNDLINRVTDGISEIMVITGPDGCITRVNKKACEVFDCAAEEFLGQSVDDLLTRSDFNALKSEYDQQVSADMPLLYQLCFIENPFEAEVALRFSLRGDHNASQASPYLLRGTRLYNKAGKEEGAILVASNLSRVKEREAQRRQEETEKALKLLEVSLGCIGHGIAVFDEKGKLLVSNEAYAVVMRCPEDWNVPGTAYKKIMTLETENASLITVPIEARTLEKLRTKPCRWESFYDDGLVIDHDTSVMPDGGFVIVARDITAQHQEAETIRRLSYAVEQSPTEIMITDTTGVIEYVNEKFTQNTGYQKDEAIGRKTSLLRPGDVPNPHYDQMWDQLNKGKSWHGEVLSRNRDGNHYWQMMSVAPMYDPDGSIKNYLAVKEDINERKQAEEELAKHRDHLQDLVEERSRELITARDEAEQANRAKTEFLSSMSHELRTPLNGILGFAQLLEMGKKDALSDLQKDYVKHILKAGHHLLGLISEILDLAKIESGKMAMETAEVDLKEVIHESIVLVTNIADERHITINNFIGKEELIVCGDKIRVKQAIVNLLSNAIKYNRDRGEVSITAQETEDRMIALTISDTGMGISDDQMKDLYTPFNRLGVEGQNIEGSGIGLTITKKLMDMMGGSIRVSSEEGVGSRFSLFFPTYRPSFDELSADGKRNALYLSIEDEVVGQDRQPFEKRKLLYVEDNWSNQTLLERAIMHLEGIDLICVSDAEAAMDYIQQDLPDMILMDLNLPGMDGFEALKVLRKQEKTKDIPIIALSAKAMEKEVQAGLDAGFQDYLTKPLDIPHLLDVIERELA
ncbi:PAS domain S-box protein [Terasakiella sp. A23]|uniref:PAS domain S-box protein n=1 Tax=Terasakiella sp. FCG-A23 TaxID=3080561 RepID=UPI002955A659|nr:PAS domain S-box protein [Terasakiella sp. A23]MDV7338365.1 PAS domain S-box protein [Terasakiella sp. A23]